MILLAFGPNGERALFSANDDDVAANVANHPDWTLRRLDGSPIENALSLADERIPTTVDAFDAQYPGLAFAASAPAA